MEEELTRVTVTVFGEDYQMKAAVSEDRVRQLAAKVDARMRRIATGNPRLGATRTAVLAALTIAEDLQKREDELARLTEQLEEEWVRHQRKQKAQ